MDKLSVAKLTLQKTALSVGRLTEISMDSQLTPIPPAIREALVCWYSPKRQGCTNENMASNPVLRDLSGNGLDLTCHNLAWNDESGIDSEGAICFDGVDDWCDVTSDFLQTSFASDFTVISDLMAISRGVGLNAPISTSDGRNNSFTCQQFRGTGIMTNWIYNKDNGFMSFEDYFATGRRVDYLTSSSFNGIPVAKGPGKANPFLFLGSEFSNARFWNGKIYSVILFNRTLTEDEIKYAIKTMIK